MQAGIVALAAGAALAPISSLTIERWFSTTVYPAIQRVVTPVSNLAPFALFDLLTVGAAAILLVAIVRSSRRARRERRLRPLVEMLARIATAAAVVYLVFLAIWGLNYRRLPMTERLAMSAGAPSSDRVVQLGLDAVERLNTLYAEAHRVGWQAEPREHPPLLAAFALVQQRLSDGPLAVPGHLKPSIYGTYFRWIGVDGMVNPFALEVLANPDLLPFERPFVAAHEWAHLAGYADESEANFVGWLTCLRADVPAQYSGWLYLYWQVSGELRGADREQLRDVLDVGPRRDIEAVLDRLRRGQLPLLRNASWRVYDQYLRANRVEEGVRSYGEVITLILRAEFEEPWLPLRRTAAAPAP